VHCDDDVIKDYTVYNDTWRRRARTRSVPERGSRKTVENEFEKNKISYPRSFNGVMCTGCERLRALSARSPEDLSSASARFHACSAYFGSRERYASYRILFFKKQIFIYFFFSYYHLTTVKLSNFAFRLETLLLLLLHISLSIIINDGCDNVSIGSSVRVSNSVCVKLSE
jgi:hypothetical protein